jgi:NQR2/RnfD/RnfE family subunit of NADH-ubiquinone oxidoreductase
MAAAIRPAAGPAGGNLPTRRLDGLRRALPPARLVWLSLALLGGYGSYYLRGIGIPTLIVLPVVAALSDLAFQRVRFEGLRFPDPALATGLFVALVLPPVAPIVLAGAAAFAAIVARHLFRYRGRPWFNPAAVGILFGATVLGLGPAWWAGVGPLGRYLVIALGLGLILRVPSSWRLPAIFLLSYGVLTSVQHLLLGATTDPTILFLAAVDPSTVFFALFLVPEPRTAPVPAPAQVVYAGTIGIEAAFFPIVFPTIGLLLALLGGNLLALLLRWRSALADLRVPSGTRVRRERRGVPSRARAPRPSRWPLSYRISAGTVALFVLVGVVATVPVAHTPVLIITGSATGGISSSVTNCTADNPSIPTSTLQSLHQALGASVILAYNSGTGVVKFYDPVNHVTVTETDLWEDYGYAEFNGDDYAVSGCSP